MVLDGPPLTVPCPPIFLRPGPHTADLSQNVRAVLQLGAFPSEACFWAQAWGRCQGGEGGSATGTGGAILDPAFWASAAAELLLIYLRVVGVVNAAAW